MPAHDAAGGESPREITLEDVRAAALRIASLARVTPLKPSHVLCKLLERPVHLKLESMQDTGAFKLRGAASMILALPEEARRRGVITVSSGNHGRAVAWVARHLGVPSVICLTRLVPQVKVDAIRSLGAEVDVVTGKDTGRLFFAPVETITGHGLELSPFELTDKSAGLDLALTDGCLTCHTDSDLARLEGVGPGLPHQDLLGDRVTHLADLKLSSAAGSRTREPVPEARRRRRCRRRGRSP